MIAEYSVDEVREWIGIAKDQAKLFAGMKGAHEPWTKLGDMLTNLLERIEEGERTVPVAKIRHFHYSGIARNGFSQEAQMLDGAPELPEGTELFINPPAQAAQGEMTDDQKLWAARELIAGMDFVVRRKDDDPLRRAPTAEPVAQGEATEFPDCSGDPSSCPENEGHGCCKAPSPDPTDGIGLSRFQAQFDDGDEE